jgi:hypothetical protein
LLAEIITAIATALTAMGGLLLAVKVLIPTKRVAEEVHHMVNQEKTDRLRFQAVLIQKLDEAGIEIPIDQSVPLPPRIIPPYEQKG